MIPLAQLWVPILLSAVIVFVASSILHMVLPYHRGEYKRVPDEDKVLDMLRGIPPGFYSFPFCSDMKAMNSPAMLVKLKAGPVGNMVIRRSGPVVMGRFLFQWFLYTLLIGIFVAYIAGTTLAPGASYLLVFRIVSTAAFLAYAFAHISDFIWKGEPGRMTATAIVDGLIYALLTAGTFGWLWPR